MHRSSYLHIYIYLLAIALVYTLPSSAMGQNPSGIVTQYFAAMQNGEVELIKSYLGGRLLNKRIALLENNKQYGSFLRNLYEDAEFIVSDTAKDVYNNETIVDFRIVYPNGTFNSGSLLIKRGSTGQWKIVDNIIRDE